MRAVIYTYSDDDDVGSTETYVEGLTFDDVRALVGTVEQIAGPSGPVGILGPTGTCPHSA